MDSFITIAIGAGLGVMTLMAMAMAVVGLPGVWVLIASAIGAWWWKPELFTWTPIVIAVALAVSGEVIELVASGAAAKKAGGSKRAMVMSIVGGLIGVIAGQIMIPIPIVGAIIGAVVGAGLFAALAERTKDERPWKDAMRVGGGAAKGRALAIVIKSTIAGLVGVILIVAVFV